MNDKEFINKLIDDGILSTRDVLNSVLTDLAPPTATGLLYWENIRDTYDKPWENIRKWFQNLNGKCEDCGTRSNLQIDHIKPKVEFKNKYDADTLDNVTLRCQRCNIRKRYNKTDEGSELPQSAMHVYVLLKYKPKTRKEFMSLMQENGIKGGGSMLDIYWSLAIWLNKEGKYEL